MGPAAANAAVRDASALVDSMGLDVPLRCRLDARNDLTLPSGPPADETPEVLCSARNPDDRVPTGPTHIHLPAAAEGDPSPGPQRPVEDSEAPAWEDRCDSPAVRRPKQRP